LVTNDSDGFTFERLVGTGAASSPEPGAPASITPAECQAKHWKAGDGQGLTGMAGLGIEVVGRHPLPTPTIWMRVEQRNSATLFGCNSGSAEEIVPLEAHIAVHVTFSVHWENDVCQNGGASEVPAARPPDAKAQIFLAVNADEVTGQSPLQRGRQDN
jgi:hypothetical protein